MTGSRRQGCNSDARCRGTRRASSGVRRSGRSGTWGILRASRRIPHTGRADSGPIGSLNGVAAVAVLTDLLPVLRLVVVVVAAEAAGEVHVADVVRIRAE